jgi:hypothetical protein
MVFNNKINKRMKNIFISIAILMFGMLSCQNRDWEFPDFDYTTTYFPFQYPVRTLVLGDYVFENENDNNLKFLISPRVGGMYQNKWDWTVDFQIDETLVENLKTDKGVTLEALPSHYYQLNPVNRIIIPKGQFHAGIEVQLTDAFLNDPLAINVNYVIPLRIVSSTTDSILSGKPNVSKADPRIAGHWAPMSSPKNFTLFGVKFVNQYHGKYLRRGQAVIRDSENQVVETVVYRQRFVEQDEIWSLQTSGRSDVVVNGVLRSSSGSTGTFRMKLTYDNNGNCVITETEDSAFPVTGTGKFVKEGDMWGNQKRDAIHLNYQVTAGEFVHTLTDTLVFRDKAIVFEEFKPVVVTQ